MLLSPAAVAQTDRCALCSMPDRLKLQLWPACCIVAHMFKGRAGLPEECDPPHTPPLCDTAFYVGPFHVLNNQPCRDVLGCLERDPLYAKGGLLYRLYNTPHASAAQG